MKTITVNVTEQDIANQDRADCYSCAVGLALSRAFGLEVGEVHVIESSYSLEGGMGRSRKLPREAVLKIRQLDNGEKIEPFAFKLKVR